ncbi:MAG TPA: OsmC family protein [Alphaproteobacteria bacterium]|nr:OsmC family protein [Alphaproteobacteria bacterium]
MSEAQTIEHKAEEFINGIDLKTLSETVDAIKADPGLGACRFRAINKWLSGTFNRSRVSKYYAAKQERTHKRKFDLDADEPPLLAGVDGAPNPVEHLLHALASCLTTSMVAHAAVGGIPIKSVQSQIEGDIDLRGFLGLSPDVPRGYTALRITFKVDADPKYRKRLKELAEFSPVMNTITNGAPVEIAIDLK